MTKFIATTEKGQKVEIQISPVNPQNCMVLVDEYRTDARFNAADTIEDGTYWLTSSSPITNEAEAKEIAELILTELNK